MSLLIVLKSDFMSNIIKIKKDVYTKSLVKGKKVYDERVIKKGGKEYRLWSPLKSKLGAALRKGLDYRKIPIKENDKILYLGISTGTTASHISDIIGRKGRIYGVEFSARSVFDLLRNLKERNNILPIYADARLPETYSFLVGKVDGVFVDVAQPDQTDIALKNARVFLRSKGYLLMAIKARSIDVSKSPKEVWDEEIKKIRKDFEVRKVVNLNPFEKDHVFVYAVKR